MTLRILLQLGMDVFADIECQNELLREIYYHCIMQMEKRWNFIACSYI